MLRVGAGLLTTGATTVVALFMIAAPLDGIAFAQPEGHGRGKPGGQAAQGLPRRLRARPCRAATSSGHAAARSDASGATACRHARRATAADISSCAAAAHCATGRASTAADAATAARAALCRASAPGAAAHRSADAALAAGHAARRTASQGSEPSGCRAACAAEN